MRSPTASGGPGSGSTPWIGSGLVLEQLAGEMGERGGAGRGVAQRAGVGLGEGYDIAQRLGLDLRRADQHERRAADHRDRREILDRVERQAGVERYGRGMG